MIKNMSTASVSTGVTTNNEGIITRIRSLYIRWFFVAMAGLFPIIAVLGFTPSYQAILQGSLHVHWVVHVHGALITSWLLVFFTQAIFAAKGNFKFHRNLGLASVVLGLLVWIFMWTVSIHVLIANHPPVESFLFDLILMELNSIITFGLFFSWGMLVRKKDSAAHKRLLFLATVVLLQAAIDRMHWLPMFGLNYPGVFFIYLDMLLIPLFIYDLLILKRIHKISLFGVAFLITVQLTVSIIWGSPAWRSFWFNLTAPLMEKVVEIKLSDTEITPLLGDYGDKNWHMTVRQDSGKLYLQLPDQPKLELAATDATELFVKTDVWNLSFIKLADGKVTRIINKQGGRNWEAARLK